MTLKKIVYIEDDLDVQKIAKIALEKVGKLEIEIYSSGFEALEKVEAFNPDLILVDVMMPEMDGPTCITKMKETIDGYKDKPYVILTAITAADEIEVIRKVGVLEVLTKPFDPMQLANKLRELYDKFHAK